MIAQLRGSVVHADNQIIILDVQGVGYAVHVSGRSQSQLATAPDMVTI